MTTAPPDRVLLASPYPDPARLDPAPFGRAAHDLAPLDRGPLAPAPPASGTPRPVVLGPLPLPRVPERSTPTPQLAWQPTWPPTHAPVTPAVPAALARLRPRPVRLPTVVHRADVGALAWAGMLADEVLVPLGRASARPAATPETPEVRAAALAPLVPARGALGRLSAVWVHAGGPAPRRADVLVASGARRPDPHPDRRTAEAALGPGDTVLLGGVRVTGPLRTVLDVARWEDPGAAGAAVHRLLAACPVDLDAALAVLDRQEGGRGVRRARRLLRELGATSGRSAVGQARMTGSSAAREPVTR